MNIPLQDILLIAPCNDLESKTIHEIAEARGLETIKHEGRWGARLSIDFITKHQDQIAGKKDLVLVELPGEEAEAILRQEGHSLHIIDHHDYSGLKRWQPKSSLEQFCELIGLPMNEDYWRIAYNDCDFIPGLSKAGVSYDDMIRIRERDREAQGRNKTLMNPDKDSSVHISHYHDLDIVLAPLSKESENLSEAIQRHSITKENYEKSREKFEPIQLQPCLLLLHGDETKDDEIKGKLRSIRKIEFYGPASKRSWLKDIMEDRVWQSEFNLWLGGGQYNAFLGAQVKEGHPAANTDGLVDQLLSLFLVTGRPLLDYNCTFFLPLDLRLDRELGQPTPDVLQVSKSKIIDRVLVPEARVMIAENTEKDKEMRRDFGETDEARLAQARDYLYTHLQNHFFDNPKEPSTDALQEKLLTPTQHFRIKPEKLKDITLALFNDKKPESLVAKAEVTDVSLWCFYNGIALLAIRAGLPDDKLKIDNSYGAAWWHELISNPEAWQRRQVNNWLRYTKLARLLYGSFHEQLTENKIGKVRWKANEQEIEFVAHDSFNPIVKHLLRRFFPDVDSKQWSRNARLRQVDDDRMHVQVAYSLAGQAPQKNSRSFAEFERLFSLALYVDDDSDTYKVTGNYAYDAQYTQKLVKAHRLDRWAALGVLSGFTSYSCVFMGYGWFFHNVIAPTHVPYVYARLTVEALFYRMSLNHYERRITRATHDLVNHKQYATQFRELRCDFIRFTNDYWFRDLTPQIQGQEIYEHIKTVFDLDKKYALMKDQMERADEYSTVLRSSHYGATAFWIAVLAIIMAMIKVDFPTTIKWLPWTLFSDEWWSILREGEYFLILK